MLSIKRVIDVIIEEIDKIENVLDDVGDDMFFRLANEQGGLEKVLSCAKEVADNIAGLVLKTEYYGSLEYRTEVFPDPKGGFGASIPDFPGCMSHGKTETEALERLKKAKAEWIEDAINYMRHIPEPNKDE